MSLINSIETKLLLVNSKNLQNALDLSLGNNESVIVTKPDALSDLTSFFNLYFDGCVATDQ